MSVRIRRYPNYVEHVCEDDPCRGAWPVYELSSPVDSSPGCVERDEEFLSSRAGTNPKIPVFRVLELIRSFDESILQVLSRHPDSENPLTATQCEVIGHIHSASMRHVMTTGHRNDVTFVSLVVHINPAWVDYVNEHLAWSFESYNLTQFGRRSLEVSFARRGRSRYSEAMVRAVDGVPIRCSIPEGDAPATEETSAVQEDAASSGAGGAEAEHGPIETAPEAESAAEMAVETESRVAAPVAEGGEASIEAESPACAETAAETINDPESPAAEAAVVEEPVASAQAPPAAPPAKHLRIMEESAGASATPAISETQSPAAAPVSAPVSPPVSPPAAAADETRPAAPAQEEVDAKIARMQKEFDAKIARVQKEVKDNAAEETRVLANSVMQESIRRMYPDLADLLNGSAPSNPAIDVLLEKLRASMGNIRDVKSTMTLAGEVSKILKAMNPNQASDAERAPPRGSKRATDETPDDFDRPPLRASKRPIDDVEPSDPGVFTLRDIF